MTVSPVQAQFIQPLCGVFKRTPGTSETGYFKLLKDKLSRFTPEDLAAAAEGIAVSAETQTWPQLGACIRACETARAKRVSTERSAKPPTETGEDYWMPEDAALRVLAHEAAALSRQACDEDWIAALVEFVRTHKRSPAGREIDDVQAGHHRLNAKIDDHVHRAQQQDGHSAGTLVALMVDGIQTRRKRMAERMRALLNNQ